MKFLRRLARRRRLRDDQIPGWIVEARREREVTRARYAGLFDEALALFFMVDPAGINFETNTDEYDAEVGTVLPRMEEAASADDVREILAQEFDQWLGGSYEPSRLDRLASDLWPLWVAWRSTRAS